MTFTMMKQGKAAEQIANRVRGSILSGDLRIGDKLPPERELIRMFGFSRAVVREGMRLLEADGLVTLHAGRNGGAVIERPGTDRIAATLDMLVRVETISSEEIGEVLRWLETQVIELAITRINATDIKALQRTITLIEENPDDVDLVRAESNRFHVLLAEATRNRMLALLARLVRQVVARMQYEGAGSDAKPIAKIHRRILDAVVAKDVATAKRRALRHLMACEHTVAKATKGGNIPLAPSKLKVG